MAPRKLVVVIILVAIIVYVATRGVGNQGTIVGTWRSETNKGTVIKFTPDGHFEETQTQGSATMVIKGRYVAGPGRMSESVTEMTVNGKTVVPSGERTREMAYRLDGDVMTVSMGATNETLSRAPD